MKVKGVIDFGTNSIKAFIFKKHKKKNSVIYKKKIENRIGENSKENSKFIEENKILASIEILKKILNDFKKNQVDSINCFGTEIFRVANNTSEVLDRIFSKTGMTVSVLSQQEELELFWKGLVYDFEWDKKIAAIDIGGGSVQFMYGTRDKLEGSYLLKTGALFLRNKFIKHEPPLKEEYDLIHKFIIDEINKLTVNINFELDTPLIHGSTSVIDFMEEAGINKQPFIYSNNHPYKIPLDDLENLYLRMRLQEKQEREKFFPSSPRFTDGASIGMLNVLTIGRRFGFQYEVPSNNSIVHGFLK